MRAVKCDRCGNFYTGDKFNNTIQLNNQQKLDLCEKCMNELELWLSNKDTNELSNKTDDGLGSTN